MRKAKLRGCLGTSPEGLENRITERIYGVNFSLDRSMWTPETRADHDRDDLRYPSDLTDAEWEILFPLLPPPARTGRHRSWEMRELINAIFFVLRGGVPWRMLPEHFPPHQTTYRWFMRFRDDGTWKNLNHYLVMLDRERVGREASPSASVIDTQSVKTTEAGGPRGFDAAKKIKGRKRHALVDTDGRALEVQVQPASVQDRDGAQSVLKRPVPGSIHPDGVRGQRLCRQQGRKCHFHRGGDRSKAGRPGWLSSSAAPLGRRTLLRLDQPQPTARQGF